MAVWHLRSRRKPTGGLRKRHAKVKKKAHRGREPTLTTIGEQLVKVIKARGGNLKAVLRRAEKANVLDPSTGRVQTAEIRSVVENRANPHYVKVNIITKGAIIETSLGLARVTSRPGQDGVVNAVLLQEEEQKAHAKTAKKK